MGWMKRYGKQKLQNSRFGESWRFLWEKLKKLYIIQLIYLVTLCLVLEPFCSWILSRLLKYKGYSYLTSEMLFSFFSDPVVIITLLIMACLWAVLLAVLQAYVYQYIEDVYSHGSTDVFSGFFRLIGAGKENKKKWLFSVIFLLFGSALFQNCILLVLACRYHVSIWYVLSNFFDLPYMKWASTVVAFVLFVFFLRHTFTVPYMICEKKGVKEAKKKSWKLFCDHMVDACKVWGIWSLLDTLFIFLLYFIASAIAIAVIMIFVADELRVAVFSTVQSHLYLWILLASVLNGMISQVNANLHLFHDSVENTTSWEEEEQQEQQKSSEITQKRIVIILLVLVLCMDIVTTYDRIRNGGNVTFEHLGQIQVTAHRGDSSHAPENTIPAIEKAIKAGADAVEIDVQETKDGEIVLMHDRTLKRTTGLRCQVNELTLEELSYLDVGCWYGKEYIGTRIPTLRQVLELCKGKCQLNIEIKTNAKTPDLEEKVVALIEEYDFARQCVVTSVYKDSLCKVKKLDSDIVTGYILSSVYGRYYLDKDIDFLSMRASLLNERVVRLSHKYGKEVHVWTVNSKKDAIWLSRLGVDNIITDRPSYVQNAIYGQEGSQTFFSLLRLVLQ